MPLYEYRCTVCNRLTEKRQKFSDPEITDCPFCGGGLERTITAPAVQFKGGGWYADGYGSKKPAASGGETPASSSGENKTESKTEAKGSDTSSASTPAAPASTPAPTSSTDSK